MQDGRMRLYLDSNVLISLIRSEIGKGFRLMYQKTEEFLLNSEENAIFVFSSLMFDEIKESCGLNKENVLEFARHYNLKFELVETTNRDYLKSTELAKRKIHYPDSLHLAIALRSNCQTIVTWNLKDFKNAQDLIKIKEPSDFTL